ncbi:MAG: M64 family metallopeptidase, partial [Acidimicrobiia bacterium]|nr:M64 family metallopeptidase [Acidimicrobiia bacterium]
MRTVVVVGVVAFLTGLTIAAGDVAPTRVDRHGSEAIGTWSDRTLQVAIEVDRDGARVVAYTLKDRPYRRTLEPRSPESYRDAHPVQVEVALTDGAGARHLRRVGAGPLCFEHGPLDEPHVAGDTVRSHRDSFVVELPELDGMDRIEVAYHRDEREVPTRLPLDSTTLTRDRFDPAAGPFAYDDLRFADADSSVDSHRPVTPTAATPLWPEDFADSQIYRIEGDAGEVDSRINIVIVPDGYRYTDKAAMDAHFDGMVSYFRTKTPYKEHDNFINYVLVYAYSQESGTDQCDCGVVLDTMMGTRFLEQVASCGDNSNRCLYYGSGCDTSGTSNITATELRAPAVDTTVVMVNTDRYGGCGGARAVYSAANGAALEVAVHELGHSLAGLADEYQGNASCGGFAGGINTSTDPVSGAWPEWIAETGAPVEGGQYYDQCIFRPLSNCEMRSLNQPFCPVCNQRWSLVYFGHPRVSPTAPISGSS